MIQDTIIQDHGIGTLPSFVNEHDNMHHIIVNTALRNCNNAD